MKGISMTSQPRSFSVDNSAPAYFLARDTRTRHPESGLSLVIRLTVVEALRLSHHKRLRESCRRRAAKAYLRPVHRVRQGHFRSAPRAELPFHPDAQQLQSAAAFRPLF